MRQKQGKVRQGNLIINKAGSLMELAEALDIILDKARYSLQATAYLKHSPVK